MSKAKTLANTVSTGGSVAATNGGTGQTGFTTGDILYSSATDTLAKLAIGSAGQVLKVAAGVPTWATDSTGTGTVTSASVVSANGFAGTVANPTTTPAITVSTSITGVLKGDGTAISAATAGTDYLAPPSGTAILKANSSGALANATAGTDYVAPSGALGTPSSGTATNLTGLPLTTGVTGTLPVANGGTGATTLSANNVLLGNGTSAFQVVAPSTSGNVLTSNGTTWASTAPAGGSPWVLLSTVTSTGAATIDIETTFDSTYSMYAIVGSGVYSASGGTTEIFIRLKIGGTYQTSGYSYSQFVIQNGTSTVSTNKLFTATEIYAAYPCGNAVANAGSLIYYVGTPSATTTYNNIWGHSSVQTAGNVGINMFSGSGGFGAMTGVRLLTLYGQTLAGKFALYGIKQT